MNFDAANVWGSAIALKRQCYACQGSTAMKMMRCECEVERFEEMAAKFEFYAGMSREAAEARAIQETGGNYD